MLVIDFDASLQPEVLTVFFLVCLWCRLTPFENRMSGELRAYLRFHSNKSALPPQRFTARVGRGHQESGSSDLLCRSWQPDAATLARAIFSPFFFTSLFIALSALTEVLSFFSRSGSRSNGAPRFWASPSLTLGIFFPRRPIFFQRDLFQ